LSDTSSSSWVLSSLLPSSDLTGHEYYTSSSSSPTKRCLAIHGPSHTEMARSQVVLQERILSQWVALPLQLKPLSLPTQSPMSFSKMQQMVCWVWHSAIFDWSDQLCHHSGFINEPQCYNRQHLLWSPSVSGWRHSEHLWRRILRKFPSLDP
jgi:hypothetical protein